MEESASNPGLKLSATVVPRSEHSMRMSDLSPNTQKVLNGLLEHDYQAYAVGGCVRDHLLGLKPKDFDVVTNATRAEILVSTQCILMQKQRISSILQTACMPYAPAILK